MIISAAKLQSPVVKDKERKKGCLVRTIRLPGASQLQESSHNHSPGQHGHHNSSHHSSSHHASPRSHHRTSTQSTASSHSNTHSHSSHSHKKKKKKRKRYASDSDDDDDSDYDPYGWSRDCVQYIRRSSVIQYGIKPFVDFKSTVFWHMMNGF